MKMIIFEKIYILLALLDAKKIFLPNINLGNKNYARRFDNSKEFICD